MNKESSPDNINTAATPPKKSNSKLILIIVGVVVGLLILGGLAIAATTLFVGDKVNNAIKQTQNQSKIDSSSDDDKYDRFANDDVDQIDDYGGRVYATKHGLPSNFPKEATIVQPSELKQITSRAPAKGETPISWHVITQSQFSTAEQTRDAIEKAYSNFGEKFDMADLPGADQYAQDSVMQRYGNEQYNVTIVAQQETEYKKGAVGDFLIVYDITVKQD